MLAQKTQVAGVVTQPDRPAGRGHKLRPTPVKAAALELGLAVFEPVSLKTFASERATEHYDLFALASYGKILPNAILEMPRLGALNVHPSLLPRYRGATPIQTALMNGDAQTGVTIMLMDAGMDTGDIVLQEQTPVAPAERYGDLHDRLAELGARLLAQALDLASRGEIPHRPQQGEPVVTRPLGKDDLEIDWTRPAAEIANLIRALAPVPGARAFIRGEHVKVLRAREARQHPAGTTPGSIAGVHDDALVIACGQGALDVLEIVPPNRRAMSGAALLR